MGASLDYIVIGQGLAGTLCSFELIKLGKRLRVIDAFQKDSPSRIAAGLMSPVTGQRTALHWNAPELLAQARATYGELEQRLSRTFYFPIPLLRIYTSQEQRRRFRSRALEAPFKAWLGGELDPQELERRGLRGPLGARVILGAGWLDCAGLVAAWRDELKNLGVLEERESSAQDLNEARVVTCAGLRERDEGFFKNLKFQPTKGELLEIEEPRADAASIYQGSYFAIPLGSGRWKLGATYDRSDFDTKPTPGALETLSKGAAGLFKSGTVLRSHKAGIRPNLLGHFPVLGALPERPGRFIFNGLGSKGALWGPYCAKVLVEHMEKGRELPASLDVNRFK
jgi:glycine/D-amino acid oxidase-like deaminating enzyme